MEQGSANGVADSFWAVCHTHPQAERWAALNLTRMGYETYLPLVTVTRRDRVTPTIRHRVEIPLFTRYLFVNLRADQRWGAVRYAAGVHQLLMNDGKPCRLAADVIDVLRAGEALRTRASGKPCWAPGVPCSPATGALRGHQAVVLAVNGDHVSIGVIFLGHLRRISVPLDGLVPIAA